MSSRSRVRFWQSKHCPIPSAKTISPSISQVSQKSNISYAPSKQLENQGRLLAIHYRQGRRERKQARLGRIQAQPKRGCKHPTRRFQRRSMCSFWFFFLPPYFGDKKSKPHFEPEKCQNTKKVYNEIVTENDLTNKSFYGKMFLFLSRGTPTRTPPHFRNYLRNLP